MRKPDDPTIATESASGETFIGRWSRRKRRAVAAPGARSTQIERQVPEHEAELLPDPQTAPSTATAIESASPTPTQTAESAPVLTDADMPALESIGDDDDYSGFMSPGVSEALRNKALRQLFMSAKFNELDGLNDYDDDFTNFEPLGDTVTADMRHRVQMQSEQAARDAQQQRLVNEQTEPQALQQEAAEQRAIEEDESAAMIVDERASESQADDAGTIQAPSADVHDCANDVADKSNVSNDAPKVAPKVALGDDLPDQEAASQGDALDAQRRQSGPLASPRDEADDV